MRGRDAGEAGDDGGSGWGLAFLAVVGIAAAVGGISNWAANGTDFTWEGLGHFGIGAGIGALAGATGGAVSGALGGSYGAMIAGGAASGAVSGGMNAGVYGGNVGAGIWQGALGGAIGGMVPSFGVKGIIPGMGNGVVQKLYAY